MADARELLRELCDAWGPRSASDRFNAAINAARAYLAQPDPPRSPRMTYANAEEYAKDNPLGGVARVFDIMADRLRTGESLESVLDDYGYAVAAPRSPPREPTEAMMIAGLGECEVDLATEMESLPRRIWRAMYNAAPAAEPVAQQPPPLTDEQIVAIRDDILPSQGECFDCIGFARAILAAAEPVAQQPPPSREHALDELTAIGQEMGEYAAQRPEAPLLRSFITTARDGDHFDENARLHAALRAISILEERGGTAPTLADEIIAEVLDDLDASARDHRRNGEMHDFDLESRAASAIRSLAKRTRELEAQRGTLLWDGKGKWTPTAEIIRALEAEKRQLEREQRASDEECDEHRADLAASRERERAAYERAAQKCEQWASTRHNQAQWAGYRLAELIREFATPDSAASPTGGER